MTITSIANLIIPLAQIYLLWRIWREIRVVAADAERREELKKQIKDFGRMFAEASDIPKPPPRGRPRIKEA